MTINIGPLIVERVAREVEGWYICFPLGTPKFSALSIRKKLADVQKLGFVSLFAGTRGGASARIALK